MRDLLIIILSSSVALFSVSLLHSKILKIAKAYHLTDNPGERKRQRHPVPMLGGFASWRYSKFCCRLYDGIFLDAIPRA